MSDIEFAGNSLREVNKAGIGILAGVAAFGLLGLVLDRQHQPAASAGERPDARGSAPRGWAVGLLTTSYGLLLPALFVTLFSFDIGAMGMMQLQQNTESTWSFARLLGRSGSWLGAGFVVLFAVVVPGVKICLIILGCIWRRSEDEALVQRSYLAISCVQKISKWACPDMFAYILLLYLVRSMDHPPTLNAIMRLDIGFVCFSVFCVVSTVSSLGLGMAPPPQPLWDGRKRMINLSPCVSLILVLLVSLCCMSLLCVGAAMPCMALGLNIDTLFVQKKISPFLRPMVESIGLQELVHTEVSLWECADALWGWIGDSPTTQGQPGGLEVCSLLAWVMLAVFALGLTALNVLTLAALSVVRHLRPSTPRVLQAVRWAMDLAHLLRKFSMLDVTVAGIVVVVLCGSIYKENGVVFAVRNGVYALGGCEVFHYAIYHYVHMHFSKVTSQKQFEL